MLLKISAKTDVGKVRDHNEDNFIVCPNLNVSNASAWTFDAGQEVDVSGRTILVVADGMGGANAGEVASQICIESLKNYFTKPHDDSYRELPTYESASRGYVVGAIKHANDNILDHISKHPETQGMGTTVVLSVLDESTLYTAWVGDSRLYLFRDNNLSLLSKDHSQVQEWVDNGDLTYEETFDHPSNNIITQHLGADEIDPGFNVIELQPNDKVLLCSDGLNGMLRDQEIAQIMNRLPEPNSLVAELIQKANEKGGRDNITVIVMEIMVNQSAINKTDKIEETEKKKKRPFFWSKPISLIAAFLIIILAGYFIWESTSDINLEDGIEKEIENPVKAIENTKNDTTPEIKEQTVPNDIDQPTKEKDIDATNDIKNIPKDTAESQIIPEIPTIENSESNSDISTDTTIVKEKPETQISKSKIDTVKSKEIIKDVKSKDKMDSISKVQVIPDSIPSIN